MAEQQSKKGKKKKPYNQAYPQRDAHPMRVLRNILQSNGRNAALSYAQDHSMTKTLDRLVATSNWARRKMYPRPANERPVHLRVGRALKRRSAREYRLNPAVRDMVHAQALAMDAQRPPKVVVLAPAPMPEAKPKAKRKVAVRRAVKTKAKAKVVKRRK